MKVSIGNSFLERLEAHPSLKARFESILDLTDNLKGEVITVDEAERRTLAEVRQLGHDILPSWAIKRVEISARSLKEAENNLKVQGKKNSWVHNLWSSASARTFILATW